MFDPLKDPMHRTVAYLKASAVAHAPTITEADLAAAGIRDELVRTHPLSRAIADKHVILEELK